MSLFGLIAYLLKEFSFLISHLKNNAFPHPLSEDEEAKAISRLMEGDPEARHRLIVHNLRLVAHVVKKFDLTHEDYDELIQIGSYGLIKAIDTFQPEKGTKLATYASKVVENEILMYLRSKKKSRKDVSLHDPVGVDKEGNEITLIDVLASEEEEVEEQVHQQIEQEKILRYLHVLDDREKDVIARRFGLSGEREQTQREVAKALGISRSYVSRIEKRALHKLYNAMMREWKKRQSEGGSNATGGPG
ncbi:MAG: RNA polymerase sporulation sigma factor SigK [Hydrogenibacillus sp.]|nr:RNA polymerase sporulation sigma factor SigK [Hydrogenibacillus sp.]